MVFLADWKSAIERGELLTGVGWEADFGGPRSALLESEIEKLPQIMKTPAAQEEYESLTDEDQLTLDFVIEVSSNKDWNELEKLVYSTFPLVRNVKGAELRLEDLATEYRGKGTQEGFEEVIS